ncbi:YkvA family protein [Pedobacter paludis]|uniref:Methyltransferase type 11 n=1 Tax=Pedobacter paludis TaxID=2203212 RepID=A0A317EWG7_9SPHI|nr:YkvA family protein [Pedobacter paludis]PWS30802.1 methyltransferase type 11 [Pedobacter paludis]
MKLNRQKILDFFKKSQNRATVILNDKTKAGETIQDALGKAVTNKGELEGVWSKLLLLFAVSKDYVNGDYTEIPKRSIIAIVGGLVYFLSPIDVLPDFVPVLGFIDDIFVLNLVYKQVLKDLEKYKIWKESQIKLIEDIDGSTAQ